MNIGILSRNPNLYSTRRLVEAAEEKGHTVQVLDHLKCNVAIESDKPMVYYKGEPLEHLDAIIPRIGASVTFYGAAIVRQMEMMQIFTANRAQSIVKSRDKLRSLQILSKAGVSIPKTAFASRTKDVEGLLNIIGGTPIIIKLLQGTQGIGVVLAESNKAAKSVIEAFYGLKADILIQEYVPEAKGADIRALVIDGEVVGAMKRQGLEGEFRSNLHRGGNAESIELTEEEKTAALRAARAMELSVAGVDMLQSSRGPMILEVNSSPGLKGIETFTGIDIASKIISFVETGVQKTR